jgi:hypothetical protein
MTNNDAITAIRNELASAKRKYPDWPDDLIHQVSIMNEEAGESIRSALNHVYHGEPIECLQDELIQTGAMVLRCLEHLPPDID